MVVSSSDGSLILISIRDNLCPSAAVLQILLVREKANKARRFAVSSSRYSQIRSRVREESLVMGLLMWSSLLINEIVMTATRRVG